MPPATRKRIAQPLAPSPRPQPGREGKVQIKAWVEPAFRKRLKGLAVELDTPMEQLIEQQLELLLKKYGR